MLRGRVPYRDQFCLLRVRYRESPAMNKGSIIHCHFPIIGKLQSIDIAQAIIAIISTERGDAQLADEVAESQFFFFTAKPELAIKPCRSSRSNTRGGFEKFHDTCKTGNKNTTKQTTTPQPNSPKHQQNKQENGKCHWVVR